MPDGAVVLIGDSMTQRLCVSTVAPCSVNYGIGSDMTVGGLNHLPEYKSLGRASAVVLAIGSNDIRFRSNTDILHNYSEIVAQLPKDTPVIVSAVLPVDQEIHEWHEANRSRIEPLNAKLEASARRTDNLFFVNAGLSSLMPREIMPTSFMMEMACISNQEVMRYG